MRNQSKVVVKILDLDSVIKAGSEEMQKKYPDLKNVSVMIIGSVGLVETKRGMFLLHSEGVGLTNPLSEANNYVVSLYKSYKSETTEITDIFPCLIFNITDKNIKDFPIIEKKNLTQFIRKFGDRLEKNFESWDKFFDKEELLPEYIQQGA